jgi:hypothetical protein
MASMNRSSARWRVLEHELLDVRLPCVNSFDLRLNSCLTRRFLLVANSRPSFRDP